METTKTYQPNKKILEKYANVLVNYALGGGEGIKKDQVVLLVVPECAKPFLVPLQTAVLRAGGHPILQYLPDETLRSFYLEASDEQLTFLPEIYSKARIDQIDHLISIISDKNMHELKGIDSKKIMSRQKALKPIMDWRNKKEAEGRFTWTVALYGTQAMAQEAELSLQEYWNQIIKACYLNDKDPVATWKDVQNNIEAIKNKLNALDIEHLHIKSKNNDLTVKIGNNRKWLGGSGRNIPSFELFISPDWRGTNGNIFCDQPLYRYGQIVRDIKLEFRDGVVVEASAKVGEKTLKEMIAVENANKIGEFSLTDVRFSKITKFMATTLFDENVGGKYGNTHIALGNAYKDSFPGVVAKVKEDAWEKMGYNNSSIHCDVISTENRVVTATLKNKKELIIYKDGSFIL